ncbi:MAG: D-alanyl-D-alanine carboxypeptidase DacC precursor [Syntrophorhabdaceae bacterium PtaU1.Bin034]|nr:MAG: D-alanyl-D-alanine carboxypeptidase DacC precursor [Syntrophorhabdaceae bacterium PtaU1.Bin034]
MARIRRIKSLLLIVAVLLAFGSCAHEPAQKQGPAYASTPSSTPPAAEAAKRGQHEIELADIVDNPKAANAIWGISIKSLATGKTLFSRNEDKLFVPASNMKLFTTAVALVRLGPDFRYTTNLYAGGKIEKGVLKGDLFLRGSGDPTISEVFQGRATAVFEDWADQLKRQGIRKIAGDVIGDGRLFDDRDMGRGWAWDDEMMYYSARISAVSFNENCFQVTVSPGKRAGQAAQIEIDPDTSYVKIINSVKTSGEGEQKDLDARRGAGSSTILLSGSVAEGSEPRRIRFTAANPTLYAMTVLKETFEKKGIRIWGRPADVGSAGKDPDYKSLKIIAVRHSEPLSAIIEHINKRSQNLYSELLFRTLGAIYGGHGTTEKAVQVIKESLRVMGIPEDELAIYDGSGLSRLDLVTPSQMVRLLDYMSKHPYFEHFYRSLPVAGVDGTLLKRMKNTAAENNVRAKTGTLAHMVSLSGYFRSRDGPLIAFSIMSNNCLSPPEDVRSLQDRICERLVRFFEEER